MSIINEHTKELKAMILALFVLVEVVLKDEIKVVCGKNFTYNNTVIEIESDRANNN